MDKSGKPLEHATVLVYHAGVKKGYSTFCPSCYVDCGKRAITGPDGRFVIKSVDPDLFFELLTVRNGFRPTFVKKVDPLGPVPPNVALLPRTAASDRQSVVRGHLVDNQGAPLRDAVVQPQGISMSEFPDGTPSKEPVSIYGEIEGLEPVAVTNEKGDFEIASEKHLSGMLLKIEARGFAPKLQALSTGIDRKTVTISKGVVVRGRLVLRGGPVAGAEIGLIPRNRGGFGANLTTVGDPYEEIRIGTQADGSFVLTDVPAPVDWYLYAKMESISKRGSTEPVEVATNRAGEVVDLGNIQLQAGHRLRGKVVLHDGARIPDGMRMIISADRAWDSQIVPIQPGGTFEFTGLPAGGYEISPAVRGYSAAEAKRSLSIEHDIDNLTVVLGPESHP